MKSMFLFVVVTVGSLPASPQIYGSEKAVIKVTLLEETFPQVVSAKADLSDLPKLMDLAKIPVQYARARENVAAEMRKEKLNPDEYVVAIYVDRSTRTLRFECWHQSVIGPRFDPNVVGDPSGGSCRTVLLNLDDYHVFKVYGWR